MGCIRQIFCVFLVFISPGASASEEADDNTINTSALSPQDQLHISSQTVLPENNGLLERNKFAIGTILTSRHFDKYDYHDYNETHNGIYLNINRWSTGTFTNSADEQSYFVTYNPNLYRDRLLVVNMVTGLANGYEGWEHAQGDYLLILGVSAQWAFVKSMLSYDAITFGFELPLN